MLQEEHSRQWNGGHVMRPYDRRVRQGWRLLPSAVNRRAYVVDHNKARDERVSEEREESDSGYKRHKLLGWDVRVVWGGGWWGWKVLEGRGEGGEVDE